MTEQQDWEHIDDLEEALPELERTLSKNELLRFKDLIRELKTMQQREALKDVKRIINESES